MKSQPQNPGFMIHPENIHSCILFVLHSDHVLEFFFLKKSILKKVSRHQQQKHGKITQQAKNQKVSRI